MSEFSENTVESVVIEGLKKMELSQAVQEDHKMITAALIVSKKIRDKFCDHLCTQIKKRE